MSAESVWSERNFNIDITSSRNLPLQEIILLSVFNWLFNCHWEPRELFTPFSRRRRAQGSTHCPRNWSPPRRAQTKLVPFPGKALKGTFCLLLSGFRGQQSCWGLTSFLRFFTNQGLLSISLLGFLCPLSLWSRTITLWWSISFTFIVTKTKMQTDLKLYHRMTIEWRLTWVRTALANLLVIPIRERKQTCTWNHEPSFGIKEHVKW